MALTIGFARPSGAGGLPEPGLLVYGVICLPSGEDPLASNKLNWRISGSSGTAVVGASIINLNGQYWYIAQVPFETRSFRGALLLPASPNTLELTQTDRTFTRTAMLGGTNTAITFAVSGATNTFTFGPADRGRIDRVDLVISPGQTFAQWLARYGLAPTSDPNSDPTQKGMTLLQQSIAGLNPNDPGSVFRISTDLQPAPGGGIVIQWSSVPGRTYSILSTTNLASGFTLLSDNVPAAGAATTYTDATAVGPGTLYYRVLVNQ